MAHCSKARNGADEKKCQLYCVGRIPLRRDVTALVTCPHIHRPGASGHCSVPRGRIRNTTGEQAPKVVMETRMLQLKSYLQRTFRITTFDESNYPTASLHAKTSQWSVSPEGSSRQLYRVEGPWIAVTSQQRHLLVPCSYCMSESCSHSPWPLSRRLVSVGRNKAAAGCGRRGDTFPPA